jgi:hypothetical protein
MNTTSVYQRLACRYQASMLDLFLGRYHEHLSSGSNPLYSLLFLILVLVGNVVVAQFIGDLVDSDNTQPVTQRVFLQVLLDEELDVALWEDALFGINDDLGTLAGNSHRVAQVAGATLNLDAVMKEFLKGSNIIDLVFDWS